MFCSNCGGQMPDDSDFCPNCGAKISKGGNNAPSLNDIGAGVTSTFNNVADKIKDAAPKDEITKNKYIGIAAIGIAAVVAIAVICVVVSMVLAGTGYKGAVKKYYSALNKANAKAMYSLIPPYLLERTYESNRYEDEDEYMDELKDSLEDSLDDMKDEYGKNFKIKYEIRDSDKYTKKELRQYNENYSNYMDKDATEVQTVNVKVTYTGKDDTDRTSSSLTVIKYKGKWYVSQAYKIQ